ncbi:MAG TPA: hypothetical protein VM010_00580 [Chitinophagaceae bacterium]|nr:hypothetical protein [Chitinophagaceae bacterium]
MKNKLLYFLLLFILAACRKERTTTDTAINLITSTDTVRFDTVFTNTGSVTQVVKLFNPATETIQIPAIRLLGGAASAFKINANGTPGPMVENMEIRGDDSAYIFVTATIPATAAHGPFLMQDSIEIAYNGNKKQVQLEAHGQNAHFIRNGKIWSNTTWKADLPYVLLGSFTIEKNAQLTISEGCRIYAHANAPILIEGTLIVQGKKWDSTRVVFSGDRLDAPYRDLPGSWPGLIFKTDSHDNSLEYAVIKNAYQAIAVEASPAANKLTLRQTIIDHAFDAGIVADNTTIIGENLLISNCGKNMLLRGGNYNFTHATIVGYATNFLPHKEPVLTVTAGAATTGLNATFRNCIFWGESGGVVPNEVSVFKNGNATFNVRFDGVLWPLAASPNNVTLSVPPLNANPEFDSLDAETNFYDFHLKENAPGRNSGVPSTVSLDLDGRPRPALNPDLGVYQKQ